MLYNYDLKLKFNQLKHNYTVCKNLKNIYKNIFNLLYIYDLKLKINQLKYNYKISNNFKNIYNKSLNMIKCKQMCLLKYRYKCKELEKYLDMY